MLLRKSWQEEEEKVTFLQAIVEILDALHRHSKMLKNIRVSLFF